MSGDTVQCYNCGYSNPSWAQVCRSCGVPLRGGGVPQPSGPLPTDTNSLISMGAAVGAIVLAVILGLFVSGLVPEAPVAVATSTPSPSPSFTPLFTATPQESVAESVAPTPEPTPAPIGTVTFGTAVNANTREITKATDTFKPGDTFCHSISLPQSFGVKTINEEVVKVAADGTETVVQSRDKGGLGVQSSAMIAGFCSGASINTLISGWGVGDHVLRDYIGTLLIAEGHFTLSK
jgi:hypothetical protein